MNNKKTIQFKYFNDSYYDKEQRIQFNKNLLNLYLNKIIFANPKHTLKNIFDDEKIVLIMNEFIFELLGCGIQYNYKSGTKKTERGLYDDNVDEVSKTENRKYIQGEIQDYFLKNIDLEDFIDHLIDFHFNQAI